MSDERFKEKLPDELKAVETALRGLTPAAGAIDRDRLMYLAGRASARQPSPKLSRFVWPLTTAALLLLSLTLGGRVIYLSGLTDRIVLVERAGAGSNLPLATIAVPGRVPASSVVGFQPQGGGFNYMQLRNTVLGSGVDTLPAQVISNPTSAPNHRASHFPSLRDDLLGS
jgi:hypothetical protein